ncbi:MAG: ATP-binding cassette domain-containing protein [Acidiferrobacterales bacterium]|nr:ATP-binding cassette domain-containing protein [Acidiferrobacterales bacterium]
MLARLQSAGVIRNGRWLIRDIDLSVRQGEILSLIGPNGSGKTTVVKVISGSIEPDKGSVFRDNNVRIGYVPQFVTIAPTLPMTARRLINMTEKFDAIEVDEALDEMNILHTASQPVQELSSGEFQRVLFARALLRKPDLLLLDEPSQGLDFKGEIKLYNQIVEIRDRLNCGILMVSHNLHMVMAKTDEVICINCHICCAGTPVHVVNDRSFEELFGQEAARSHALYRHHHDHSHLPDGSIGVLQ